MEGCSASVCFGEQSSSILPRMVRARCVSKALEARAGRIQQAFWNRLAMADARRSHEQGASWRGKKQVQTRPTEASSAPNGRSSPMLAASSWGSRLVRPISMTSGWPYRPWRVSPSIDLNLSHGICITCALTKPTILPISVACSSAGTTHTTSSPEAKKCQIAKNTRTGEPDAGSTRAPNPGSTDSDAC